MAKKKQDAAAEIIDILSPKDEINGLPYIETGEVISPLPDLKVKLRDLIYRKENIKLDDYWVKGHKRKITIPSAKLTGTDARGDSHIVGGFPEAEIIFKDELEVGDKVAVMQSKDKQSLYVFFRIGKI